MDYLEAFTKVQTQTPIFPPDGMRWVDADPTAITWGEAFDICRSITRVEAIYLLSKFPNPILHRRRRTDRENLAIKNLSFQFAVVAAFLIRWERGQEASELRRPETELCESFGLVCEARYRKIRGLFDRPEHVDLTDFGSPAFLWLLCEAAVCRQMVLTSGIELSDFQLKSNSTKKGLYNSTKDYLQSIWEPSETEETKSFHSSCEEALTNLDRDIEAIARVVAANDKTFDRGYYKPYLQARTHYNALFRNTPEVKIVDAREPEPPSRKRSRGKRDFC